jgi:hypothetical protein
VSPGSGLNSHDPVTSRFDPEVVLDAVIAANTVAIESFVLAVLGPKEDGNPKSLMLSRALLNPILHQAPSLEAADDRLTCCTPPLEFWTVP